MRAALVRLLAMQLEWHQLDRRYEALRTRNAQRERTLLGSIAQLGQQMPVVVVRDGDSFVLVDGYKRMRALHKLGHDLVEAVEWAMSEPEALLLERALRTSDAGSAIEQGWLLRELHTRFGLSQQKLAERLDRTQSWVSRRIALVEQLPASVQEHVRTGAIGAHAAMKSLVPMARANADDCVRLSDTIAPERLSDREVTELYAVWSNGNERTRTLVVSTPMVVLKARESARDERRTKSAREQLFEDLRIVTAVARRVHGRIADGVLAGADASDLRSVVVRCDDAIEAIQSVRGRCETEASHARSEHSHGNPAAA